MDSGENNNLNDAAAYLKSGVEFFEKKDYDGAIADYTEAIRLNPNGATAYSNRGLAYLKKGDHDQAIADFTEAIQLKPNGVCVYYFRGVAYAHKKDYDRAIADFTEAVRFDPSNATKGKQQCKRCGKSVDSDYTACPHCGASDFE
jgi:tetratricopeptide (TPR) repeat protein